MSFYITIKSIKRSSKQAIQNCKVALVITSKDHRLFTSFVQNNNTIEFQDSFIAQSNQQSLDFKLIKQKIQKKSALYLSSNSVNLSMNSFETNDQKRQITLLSKNDKQADLLTILISYRANKHYIGPIQFYKRGGHHFLDQDQQQYQESNILIQGQNDHNLTKDNSIEESLFNLFKRDTNNDKVNQTQVQKRQNQKKINDQQFTGKSTQNEKQKLRLQHQKKADQVICFYTGAHKNRNIFSFCDQVYDDQKFTIIQDYYNKN